MPQNNRNKIQTMNPLRALFLSLAKMPPAVMLLIVIGLAVLVTMMVTGKVSEQENQYREQKTDSAAAQDGRPMKKAYYSVALIPQGSTIERKQIQEKNVDELELWDDASADVTSIVGRKPKKEIPLNAQIRQSDLESLSQ